MADVSPAPRRRIRPAANAAPAPRARTRPAAEKPEAEVISGHDLYEPYDGPPPLSPVRGDDGQLSQPQRAINDRVGIIAQQDKGEAEALILQTLHQFVLARTPSDVIAQRMGMSMRSLRDWRGKLNAKLREDAKTKDPFDYIGSMLGEMEELKAQAWREIAAAKPTEWSRRMRAIDAVMKANGEINRLLQVAGMYDNQPMRQPLQSSNEDDGGASVLKQLAENFLTGGYEANADHRKSLRPGDVIVDGD